VCGKAGVAETSDGDNTMPGSRQIRGAARQAGQTRSHFATDAEDQQVAIQGRHRCSIIISGPREVLFQVGYIVDVHH
jgi:hypothetical protein